LWTDRWTDQRTDRQMGQQIDQWTDQRMDQWTDGQTDRQMDGHTDGQNLIKRCEDAYKKKLDRIDDITIKNTVIVFNNIRFGVFLYLLLFHMVFFKN